MPKINQTEFLKLNFENENYTHNDTATRSHYLSVSFIIFQNLDLLLF